MARIALFCAGNPLMADDGLGPAVFRELFAYDLGEDVDAFDVGCLSLDCLNAVRDYDLIVTVDAIDGTGEPVGAIVRFEPDDMAGRPFGAQSLHDMKLKDLFDAAALVGYEARGLCLGMQVANAHPACVTVGLTSAVQEALPTLVECVLAELVREGACVRVRATGEPVAPGFRHVMGG